MKQKTENRKPITSQLFGVPISITSLSQALALVGEWLKEWKEGLGIEAGKSSIQTPAHFPKLIVTPNPEIIVAAQNDPEFLKALQSADLAIPDGVGVVWAVKILNDKFRILNAKNRRRHSSFNIQNSEFSRLSGLDLMESLILQPQKVAPYELRPLKVLLLGGRPGVAQAAAKILSENSENSDSRKVRQSENQKSRINPSGSLALRYSDGSGSPSIPSFLKIKALSGPKDIVHTSKSELDELINSINSFQPDLLFVAFGHPRQEKWLTENRERLTVGVAMGVGGAFDQLADPSLRPPIYINSIGLGWLYRLLRQPWRIKRQLALVKFVGMVINLKTQISKLKA